MAASGGASDGEGPAPAPARKRASEGDGTNRRQQQTSREMKKTKRHGVARRELPAAVGDSARSALLSWNCADSASKPNSATPWGWEGASKRGGRARRIPKGHALWRGPGPRRPSRKTDSPRSLNRGLLFAGELPAMRPLHQNSTFRRGILKLGAKNEVRRLLRLGRRLAKDQVLSFRNASSQFCKVGGGIVQGALGNASLSAQITPRPFRQSIPLCCTLPSQTRSPR